MAKALAFAAFCASSPSRVHTFLSAKADGRSSGTSELKFHTPRKSGWPYSVRGALYFGSGPAADAATVVKIRRKSKDQFRLLISFSIYEYDDFAASEEPQGQRSLP